MNKKVSMIKAACTLCSVILLSGTIAFPSVFASESIDSASTSMGDGVTVYFDSEISAEMEEFCSYMILGDTLQEGEERVLGTWNGEEFCVRVTDVTEKSYSAYTSTSKDSAIFTFYKKNILGVKKDVLIVTSECTWIKGSKIISLKCTYDALVTDIACSWNDDYKMANDTLHTLGLDVTYDGKAMIIFFGAGLSLDKQTLTLDCSADYEL